MTQHFDETTFDEAIASGVTVVDFWADWCGPCRMVAPVIDRLAQDFDGRATVGKVRADDCYELAQRYGVTSIPTVIIFKDGAAVNTLVGARDLAEYTAAVEEWL